MGDALFDTDVATAVDDTDAKRAWEVSRLDI